jgi:gamma-glutamylaminecyclotransferase
MLLFVYGTLRRGADNHDQLRGARLLGSARTRAAYELVDMGGYPALLEAGRTAVVGELYEVEETLRRKLDAFEEVPTLYVRKHVSLDAASERLCRQHGSSLAEAYVMRRAQAASAPRLEDGNWLPGTDFSLGDGQDSAQRP